MGKNNGFCCDSVVPRELRDPLNHLVFSQGGIRYPWENGRHNLNSPFQMFVLKMSSMNVFQIIYYILKILDFGVLIFTWTSKKQKQKQDVLFTQYLPFFRRFSEYYGDNVRNSERQSFCIFYLFLYFYVFILIPVSWHTLL